jgi:hypothetical protein
VVDACAEFFHVGTPSTVSSDAISPQRPQDRTLAGSYLTVNQGDGGEVPRSPGISRRGSFAIVPPDAPAFVFDKNASDENTLNDTGSQLASSSVAHVLVHCYPRETKQQICFVAQRHRYEFTHRPDDRILHFIVVEYAKGSPAPTAEATLALHKDFVQSVAMGDSKRRVHVAIKAAAVEDVAKGLDEDELRALIKRFLQANPANIVRLPVHGSVGFHAAFVNHFANLALITGHGYDLVTPDTAAHAVVRRPRNYVFCAERSKTSERAARVIGLMLNPRHGDVCVVETIWHVGMQSFGHAYNDDSTEWKDHLGSLRAGSVRLAEHFKGQVAREAGRAVAALKSNQRPAEYDHRRVELRFHGRRMRPPDRGRHHGGGLVEQAVAAGAAAQRVRAHCDRRACAIAVRHGRRARPRVAVHGPEAVRIDHVAPAPGAAQPRRSSKRRHLRVCQLIFSRRLPY